MAESRLNSFWTALIILLIVAIVAGGVVIIARYQPAQPLEISLPQTQDWQGTIHIDGAVANPGFYPFRARDTIDSLIQAAGGADSSANQTGVKLYVGSPEEEKRAQKVDINRAEAWLLEALPGIGKTLAQRIVTYREQNGPLRTTDELLRVPGIGTSTYDQVKSLIIVGE